MAGVKGKSGRKPSASGMGKAIWIPRELVESVEKQVSDYKTGVSQAPELSPNEKIEQAIAEVLPKIPISDRKAVYKGFKKLLQWLESVDK